MCQTIIERAASHLEHSPDSGDAVQPRTIRTIVGDLEAPILEIREGCTVLVSLLESASDHEAMRLSFCARGIEGPADRLRELFDELWGSAAEGEAVRPDPAVEAVEAADAIVREWRADPDGSDAASDAHCRRHADVVKRMAGTPATTMHGIAAKLAWLARDLAEDDPTSLAVKILGVTIEDVRRLRRLAR